MSTPPDSSAGAPRPAPSPADEVITFSKTVGESDVYLFAGVTGDLSPVHVDQEYMRKNSPYGERIAHGVLILGFTTAASMVSLGYDGVRFVAPVRIGDTITVRYRLAARDDARQRTTSEFEVANQRGETVLVGRHIMKWFD
jgi:3-hydroxybutyryl-CoA dehydratase